MEQWKHSWKRVPGPVRKTLVLMIGSAVVAGGLVMVVTPGPGWAAILFGFAILATEFAFAEKIRDWMLATLKRGIRRVTGLFKRSAKPIASRDSQNESAAD